MKRTAKLYVNDIELTHTEKAIKNGWEKEHAFEDMCDNLIPCVVVSDYCKNTFQIRCSYIE